VRLATETKCLALALTLVGLSSIALSARAQTPSGSERSALDANAAFDAALSSKNREALDALLDLEFTWIFPDGTFYGHTASGSRPSCATGLVFTPSSMCLTSSGLTRAIRRTSAGSCSSSAVSARSPRFTPTDLKLVEYVAYALTLSRAGDGRVLACGRMRKHFSMEREDSRNKSRQIRAARR